MDLHQRLADALRDAAMDLAIAEQFVDDLADIVDGGVTRERDHAGLRIDLDFAEVAAVGKVRRLGGEGAGRLEADLELRRQEHRPVAATAPPSVSGSARSVPTMWKLPSLNSRSPAAASSIMAAMGLAFSMMASAARLSALPPTCMLREP